jgi:hypothetical protein
VLQSGLAQASPGRWILQERTYSVSELLSSIGYPYVFAIYKL